MMMLPRPIARCMKRRSTSTERTSTSSISRQDALVLDHPLRSEAPGDETPPKRGLREACRSEHHQNEPESAGVGLCDLAGESPHDEEAASDDRVDEVPPGR